MIFKFPCRVTVFVLLPYRPPPPAPLPFGGSVATNACAGLQKTQINHNYNHRDPSMIGMGGQAENRRNEGGGGDGPLNL